MQRIDHTFYGHRLHNGQRPYCCQVCGKQFRHRSYFKVHVQAHQRSTSSKARSKVIAQRPKEPTTNDNSRTSPRSVSLAEPLQVTEKGKGDCKFKFSRIFDWFEPFLCMCVGVVQRQPLHAQIFENEEETAKSASAPSRPIRPFKCLQCGAAFKKSAHLNQHSRTHSGIKPFTCNTCLRFDNLTRFRFCFCWFSSNPICLSVILLQNGC